MAFSLLSACFSTLPPPAAAEDGLGDLLDRGQIGGDLEQLQENLDALKARKIRINEAEPDALRQLPWLNSGDISSIVEVRRTRGAILSLRQLEAIIGPEKTARIAPYVTFARKTRLPSPEEKEPLSGSFSSRVLWDTTPRDGLSDGRYPGDHFKLYNRLQLDYGNFQANLVHDKDIGEPDVADFVSLSLSASDLGIVQQAVLGNYRLNFGQGLLVGQSRFMSKGSEPSNSVRIGSKRLSPSSSSSEYGFFQGAAATLDLKPLEVTAFWSANLVDARNTTGTITSFDEAGYHRTMTERKRKDNVTETVYGASLLYRFESGAVSGKAGGTWLRYDYGEPLKALGSVDGSSSLGGVECDLLIGRLGFFGEAAWSEKPHGRVSWIAGADYQVLPKVNLLFAVRDYDPGYYSPFAGAFAERGDNASNEKGCYFGIEGAVSSKVSLGAYVDWFRFPVLDDHTDYASDGFDTRVFLDYRPSGAVALAFQYQHRYKEEQKNQGSSSSPVWTALPHITDRFRLDCDIDVSRRLHLRTRGEVKRVVKEYLAGDETYYGWLLYQQANFRVGSFGLKGRFTLFHTDDYDAAIYTYEDDLPLVFNSTAFSGRGKALFLVASWDVSRNLKLAGKFETTWYDDRDVYSSGADERDTSAPGSFHLGCSLRF
ncbi:MAG: helix-hairpin-helix domain-containing protein [Chlorobiaceae bacterium]|nr:helix-hairpin-helix domain-containing protein [Chlorobiaceae bacterium]